MEGRAKEERDWSISFWNVAGFGNRDKDFWNNLKWWEVIMLET